ncbi:MAG: hypothetical protein IJA97_04610 [Clostridia bacterium]|nr:hypothetical protein [Clostridia bacterium]
MTSEGKKLKIKAVIKTLLIATVLVISYAVSVVTSSFYETNKKLIILLICFFAGILLFLLIYVALYLVTLSKIKRRAKRLLKRGISCDDNASKYFEKKEYKFRYDSKLSFTQNLQAVKDDALGVIKDVSSMHGNVVDKYFYLGYTVYDATSLLYGALDLVDNKITPIFKMLHAEDKPLGIVENLLEKAIESDGTESAVEVIPEKPSLLKKIGLGLVKAGTFIFKGKIETAMTEVVKFVGFKAFEVYEKGGRIARGGNDDA